MSRACLVSWRKKGSTLSHPVDWRIGLHEAENLLRQGFWDKGWPLYAQWAWGDLFSPIAEELPEWNGEDLKGKRILVVPVGGYGDNIMCFRWFSELRKAGAIIYYLCPNALARLIGEQENVHAIIPLREGQEYKIMPEKYDYFVPSMALPMKFGGSPLPWMGPYIVGKKSSVIETNKVGLCTQAGEGLDSTKKRSLSRVQEMAIRSVPLRWVNLNFKENPKIYSFHDTARIISELSAVVTVDTAVMHLAGAMGVKTFVLIGQNADWKFGTEGKCPFYPTVKVFRDISSLVEELQCL